MPVITVTEIARNFAEYVNRVAFRHESFTLVRGRRPVAELRPVPQGHRLSELPALLGSLPHLDAEEAASFAHDLAEAKAAARTSKERISWES